MHVDVSAQILHLLQTLDTVATLNSSLMRILDTKLVCHDAVHIRICLFDNASVFNHTMVLGETYLVVCHSELVLDDL